jgi:hypothetical protein
MVDAKMFVGMALHDMLAEVQLAVKIVLNKVLGSDSSVSVLLPVCILQSISCGLQFQLLAMTFGRSISYSM